MKLRAENIQKSYKGRRVVKDVSIEVNQGEIVGLLGPNGAGKTTSFYMIVGLVKPNAGHVFLNQSEITHFPMYKRAQMGVGYLPQEVSVFRKMSIEDNILSVLEMMPLPKRERQQKLEQLIDEFGLGHVRKNLGQSLSGGEKRRTEIARALATDPKFILLDEPFAGVDPIAVEDIQRIVAQLKQRNIGVLITDHNVQETLSITDRTYLLFEGTILKSGTAEKLAADPQVRKVYLGQNFVLRKASVPAVESTARNAPDQGAEGSVSTVRQAVYNCKKIVDRIHQRPVSHRRAMREARLLTAAIDNFKKEYPPQKLGARAKELYHALRFGPAATYHLAWNLQKGEPFFPYLPLVGWTLYLLLRFKVSQCRRDADRLLTTLQRLEHLIAHPDLEEML